MPVFNVSPCILISDMMQDICGRHCISCIVYLHICMHLAALWVQKKLTAGISSCEQMPLFLCQQHSYVINITSDCLSRYYWDRSDHIRVKIRWQYCSHCRFVKAYPNSNYGLMEEVGTSMTHVYASLVGKGLRIESVFYMQCMCACPVNVRCSRSRLS